MSDNWTSSPPTEPGSYWFYGDPWFGSMGGHYSGTVPPDPRLCYVEVFEVSNGLLANTCGQFMELTPFDRENRREGYKGVWQPAVLPTLPTDIETTKKRARHA